MSVFKSFYRIIALTLSCAFVTTSINVPSAQAEEIVVPVMPAPGSMVNLSPAYEPAFLKGIVIHPDNALKFDFIVQRGDGNLSEDQKKIEYNKLIKYFLASLAVPDKDQWVNLSPYEKNRIIKDDLGKTEMGRDLLAQDYLLKQITSSLIYPEKGLGKKFWDEVYAKAYKEYGNTNIPVNTFNKVWIMPDKAVIYEKNNTAYVVESRLKVMLDEDYVSLQKHNANQTHPFTSKIVRQIILPAIEKEVNEGKNFALLRQVYSGMLLAAWYKRALKESLLGKIYADKAKVRGVDQDPKVNEAIYEQYLQAFKKGVFNYIKEDDDPYTQQVIHRKYFSGGTVGWGQDFADHAQIIHEFKTDQAQTATAGFSELDAVTADLQLQDKAISGGDYAMRSEASKFRKQIAEEIRSLAVTFQVNKIDDLNARLGVIQSFENAVNEDEIGPFQQREGNIIRMRDSVKENEMFHLTGALKDGRSVEIYRIPSHGVKNLKSGYKERHFYVFRIEGEIVGYGIATNHDSTLKSGDQMEPGFDILVKYRGGRGNVRFESKELFNLFLAAAFRMGAKKFMVSEESEFGRNVEGVKGKRHVTLGLWVGRGFVLKEKIQDIDRLFLRIVQERYRLTPDDAQELLNDKSLDQDRWWEFTPTMNDPSPEAAAVETKISSGDNAMNGKETKLSPGGIDLNSANFSITIKRDGKGVPLPLVQQDMAQLGRIQGFVPRIIEIRPAASLPILSELKQKLQAQPTALANAS